MWPRTQNYFKAIMKCHTQLFFPVLNRICCDFLNTRCFCWCRSSLQINLLQFFLFQYDYIDGFFVPESIYLSYLDCWTLNMQTLTWGGQTSWWVNRNKRTVSSAAHRSSELRRCRADASWSVNESANHPVLHLAVQHRHLPNYNFMFHQANEKISNDSKWSSGS